MKTADKSHHCHCLNRKRQQEVEADGIAVEVVVSAPFSCQSCIRTRWWSGFMRWLSHQIMQLGSFARFSQRCLLNASDTSDRKSLSASYRSSKHHDAGDYFRTVSWSLPHPELYSPWRGKKKVHEEADVHNCLCHDMRLCCSKVETMNPAGSRDPWFHIFSLLLMSSMRIGLQFKARIFN